MIVGDGSGDPNLENTVKYNGTAGVTAGSFSAITAIQTKVGGTIVLTGTSDARLKNIVAPFVADWKLSCACRHNYIVGTKRAKRSQDSLLI